MDVNIIQINGNWKSGYVLDKQIESSTFIGYNDFGHPDFDTVRTDIGEAIYQLKYKKDLTQIAPLADAFVDNLKKQFANVGFIVPMPPTKYRKTQPLIKLAKKVGEKMKVPVFNNILIKNPVEQQIKDIKLKEDKIKALANAFAIKESITNEGQWDVLIIDDLYNSGASLEAAAQILATYSKVKNIHVGAFSRTGKI